MKVTINTEALRDYMEDEYGTAAYNGFPAAAMDAWEIENMDPQELCERAEEIGVDLMRFAR